MSDNTANSALEFLEAIKQRQSPQPPAPTAPATPSPNNSNLSATTSWYRLEIVPGLEIHLREDFIYPASPQEQQLLQQSIADKLVEFYNNRRASS